MDFNQFALGSDSADSRSALVEKLNSLKEKLKLIRQQFDHSFFQEIDQALTTTINFLSTESSPLLGTPENKAISFEADQLQQTIEKIYQCQSQTEILNNLIKYLSTLYQRVALFIISGDNCIGWLASGFGEQGGQGKKKITVPLSQNHVINHVYRSYASFKGNPELQPGNASLLQMIGAITPTEIMASPLIIKGKVAGVIYLDQGFSNKPITNISETNIICRITGMVIDLLPFKKQYQAPPVQKAPEPAPSATPQWDASTIKAPPQPPPAAPQSPPVSTQAPPNFIKPPLAASQPSPVSPPISPPSSPAPPEPSAPPISKEVPDEQQKLHDDAQRLARLLVSEIKLYNESKLAIAREEKNIYQTLKEDIERSREMFNQRIPGSIRSVSKYFDDELVKILANGDPSLLGI